MHEYRTSRVAPAESSMTELIPSPARPSDVYPHMTGAENRVMPYRQSRSQPVSISTYPSNSQTLTSVKNPNAVSSSRKFLIIASVVGLLIGLCIAGIPLGILTTSYLQQKAKGSSDSGQSSSQGSVSLPAQCSTYTNITDASRLTTCTGTTYYDCSWTAGWYRIVNAAGTKLAMMPSSNSYCCTSYPGWFNGTLPATSGASTVGMYCVQYNGYVCYSSFSLSTILVTNCDSFYIYFLPAMPSCNSRYCTA